MHYFASNNVEEASAWDKLYLDSKLMPGLAMVTVQSERTFEAVKVNGKDGGPQLPKGLDQRVLTVMLRLTTADELDAFANWVKDYNLPGSVVTPIIIDHPQAYLFGVSLVYIKSVVAPPADRKVGFVPLITLVEHKDVPAPQKVESSKNKNAGFKDAHKNKKPAQPAAQTARGRQ